MKVNFSTKEYECAHGKRPRGNGCWMFEANGKLYECFGLYSAAKDYLKDLVKADNPNEVVVTVKVLS